MVQLTREQLALPLTPLALGEVDHAEQDQLRAIERPRVEHHRAPSDAFELVLDLEVRELAPLWQDLRQALMQFRNVPLQVAQLRQRPALRHVRGDLERFIERGVGRSAREVRV